MNTLLLIVLRLMHVVGGALWVSVVVFFKIFLYPALASLGVENPRFGQALNQRNRFAIFMRLITVGNILSGLVLYYLSSGGLKLSWITSGPGIGYSLGALAGMGAFLAGGIGMGRVSPLLQAASRELAAQGKTPKPELVNRVKALQGSLHLYETLDFWFLVIAMLLMATARYWNF